MWEDRCVVRLAVRPPDPSVGEPCAALANLDLPVKCQSGIDLFGVIRAIKRYMRLAPRDRHYAQENSYY